jgi:hypothetical protein
MIRKYFNTRELIHLITNNFFSVLYYNSEVWSLTSLGQGQSHGLSLASARALRVCQHFPDSYISYMDLHKITKKATPEMFC